jgi:hypothetical protein
MKKYTLLFTALLCVFVVAFAVVTSVCVRNPHVRLKGGIASGRSDIGTPATVETGGTVTTVPLPTGSTVESTPGTPATATWGRRLRVENLMKTGALVAIIVASAVALSLLVMLDLRRQHNALANLPPKTTATLAEVQHMLNAGVDLVAVAGTGSMRPYIPAGDGIVAYCERKRVPFAALEEGNLVIFRAGSLNILHQLAEREGDSWIATGLHNSGYDATRVSAENYMGVVVRTYIVE